MSTTRVTDSTKVISFGTNLPIVFKKKELFYVDLGIYLILEKKSGDSQYKYVNETVTYA